MSRTTGARGCKLVYVNLSWSISTNLGSSRFILIYFSGYLELSSAILDKNGISRTISGYLRIYQAISGLWLYQAISGNHGLSWAISYYLGLYLDILSNLGLAISGKCWLSLAVYGYLWLSLSRIKYQGASRSRKDQFIAI